MVCVGNVRVELTSTKLNAFMRMPAPVSYYVECIIYVFECQCVCVQVCRCMETQQEYSICHLSVCELVNYICMHIH